jgi:hypothetical protein
MSIWTELLFLHGHVATPAALALIVPAACDAATPRSPTATTPAASPPAGAPRHHPLRTVGQLR